jgi:hypothetical protein
MAYSLSELVTAAGSKFRTLYEAGTERHFPVHGVTSDGDNVATVDATLRLRTYDDDVYTAITSGVATALPAGTNNIGYIGGTDYETVAASQTDQMMGASGAVGDYLAGVLIIPATTSPGAVSIEDGATNIVVFAGGASSVSNLVPFMIPLGIKSVSGGWEITTGANVSAIAVGNFT